jgi:hypothetical protein
LLGLADEAEEPPAAADPAPWGLVVAPGLPDAAGAGVLAPVVEFPEALWPAAPVGALAARSAADPLQAVVLGPRSPGGAPPGSGTQARGFEGSVSFTPG